MSHSISLPTPTEFNAFPYSPPYSIQVDLMRHLYSAIENRRLTVVESPTGTGKTLSLLCASLSWLCDDKIRSRKGQLENLRNALSSGNDPEWVLTQSFERMKNELEMTEVELEKHLANLRRQEQASRRREKARITKRPRVSNEDDEGRNEEPDESFLPDNSLDNPLGEQTNLDTVSYDKRLVRQISSDSDCENTAISTRTKIFYTSRTHSQLSQVLHELVKLNLTAEATTDFVHTEYDQRAQIHHDDSIGYRPRTVQLASRAHLCINETLRARATDLDEGCRELLAARPDERCPYIPPIGDETRMFDLRDRIIADPKDIEDLVTTGKSLKTCPYFGSRSAIPSAELVTLPYNLLLHKRARQALNIDLTDHYLIESILQLHTVDLSTSVLRVAANQLKIYLDRFRTRLNATHALNLKRLVLFLEALDQFASVRDAETKERRDAANSEDVLTVSAFVESMGNKVNGINFLELQTYLMNSKIARKVCGYAKKSDESDERRDIRNTLKGKPIQLPLHAVEAFISCLTNDIEDGIITFYGDSSKHKEMHIKYQHLNPATHFNEILSDARCVILAGGTMSPISDVAMQLFPAIPDDRISIFSCGHVIPPSNLQCLVVGKGPRGKDLQLKFIHRNDRSLLDELGLIMGNLVNIVPHGMVVFFPSYSFLESIKEVWTTSGLISRLQKKKQIFYEPLESSEVENVLRDYSLASATTTVTSKGALIFAVVGAKLSEGLNFADELARAVVLVGLPYPNLASPELKKRMNFVKDLAKKRGNGSRVTSNAGSELYENLCMRAVNQSIGRAIRHKNDWASLILVDSRYGSPKVRNKLPAWIDQSILQPESFGQAVKFLGEFYRSKR
ncbi:DNA repair helicase [Phellopilus nigrolimitatus]|nr:DNA repair helicase [Phellopilus nigrolimitatus]